MPSTSTIAKYESAIANGVVCLLLVCCLEKVTERQWLNCGEGSSLASWSKQEICGLWKDWSTLQVDLNTSRASEVLSGLVLDLSLKDFLLALGLADVLNTDMDTLLKNTSINELVDTNTDSRLGHVEDNSSSSVVTLVWHTLVDGWISENVDIVTNLDLHQILRKVDRSVLTVLLSEHVARTRSCTEGVRHLELFYGYDNCKGERGNCELQRWLVHGSFLNDIQPIATRRNHHRSNPCTLKATAPLR